MHQILSGYVRPTRLSHRTSFGEWFDSLPHTPFGVPNSKGLFARVRDDAVELGELPGMEEYKDDDSNDNGCWEGN